MSKTFLYFAYGSNLLSKRIRIDNPNAVRYGIGKLENYDLDFVTYTSRWKGAAATIVPRSGRHVWGAVWNLGIEHLESLDKQEGVHDNVYFPHEVEVVLNNGKIEQCRVYQQSITPCHIPNIKDLPEDRRPSPVYLATIILGAKESGLPEDYQEFLKKIPHNGYKGSVEVDVDLDLCSCKQTR